MDINSPKKLLNNNTPNYHESVSIVRGNVKEEVYKTTDLGLNRFKLTHSNIFNKIGGLDIKKHFILAQEIVKSPEVGIDEIKSLVSDENVDSNIRMELVSALYENGILIDQTIINSLIGKKLTSQKSIDGVVQISSKSYGEKLFIFTNGLIYKGYLDKVEKDNNSELNFIYSFLGNKKINSYGSFQR